MKPVVLKLSDPKLAAAVVDLAMMQRWEVLRRSDTPITPQELAESCGISAEAMQQTLDRLVDAGLAVRVKASVKSKAITYRSVGKEIVIEFDEQSDAECASVDEHHAVFRQYGQGLLDHSRSAGAVHRKKLNWLIGDLTATFNEEESSKALEIVTSALHALHSLEHSAHERLRSESRAPTVSGATTTPSKHYYAVLQMQQLDEPQLPLPTWTFWSRRTIKRMIEKIERRPSTVLTAREREIAKRLSAGDSRPDIAKSMGITKNTIASMTKRIYAKLGVHSRAELAARMLEA
jgi:DNA-binding CsgD family transcriptional regulator/DNA-binding MarR family transcriptional regulator